MAVDAMDGPLRLLASMLSETKLLAHEGGSALVRIRPRAEFPLYAFVKVQVPVSAAPAGGASLRVPLPHSYWLFLSTGCASTAPPVLVVPVPANSAIETL